MEGCLPSTGHHDTRTRLIGGFDSLGVLNPLKGPKASAKDMSGSLQHRGRAFFPPRLCSIDFIFFAFENEPLVSLGTTASTGRGPRQRTTWRAPTTIATPKVCKEDQGGRCKFIKIRCFSLPPWAPDSASVFPMQRPFAAVRSRSRGEAVQQYAKM